MTDSPLDPIALAADLIKCRSITPADAGALDVVQQALENIGFDCTRLPFQGDGAATPIDNLYARLGRGRPHFCFAGHTDVVPPGDEDCWRTPPFVPSISEGRLYGRGAVDMKGAIAAFISAVATFTDDFICNQSQKVDNSNTGKSKTGENDKKYENTEENNTARRNTEKFSAREKLPFTGSISLLITGDEEGEAINGTRRMLDWVKDNDEIFDHCLVGEPSNPETLGEMIKIGRRGSLNAWLRVIGSQGHVAYPHLADNPLPKLIYLLSQLLALPLDDGYPHFDRSNLEITQLSCDQGATNVIPATACARLNIRFNPTFTGESLRVYLHERLEKAARAYQADPINWHLETRLSGEAFLTQDTEFTDLLRNAIEARTGHVPALSTTGGTSDARFIKDIAPVAEFGLISRTMHKIDECVDIKDITRLRDIYLHILRQYFSSPV